MHMPSDETEQYDEPDTIVQRGGDAVCAIVKPTIRARQMTSANTLVHVMARNGPDSAAAVDALDAKTVDS
jgi:hypothetical protein